MKAIQKVLVTGVYGLVGNVVYQHLCSLSERFEVYGADRHRLASERARGISLSEVPSERFFQFDVADWPPVREAVEHMDLVVHLAADPRPEATWDTILPANLCGVYHVLEASRQAGVTRVVYASSMMTLWGHLFVEPCTLLMSQFQSSQNWETFLQPEIPRLTHLSPPCPNDLYGASKVWGEALAQVYAAQHFFSCLCVRFGTVTAEETLEEQASPLWCSQQDAGRIVACCLEAPETLTFDIFYALSNSPHPWVDLEHGRQLIGYVPRASRRPDQR
jgi:NAD+ dependent glucose-6-phosphate dehydrogenase